MKCAECKKERKKDEMIEYHGKSYCSNCFSTLFGQRKIRPFVEIMEEVDEKKDLKESGSF